VTARPLRPLYRVDVLIEALATLSGRLDDWQCSIFGDGPERPALEARVHELGLGDRISFHGQRPPEEVEEALAAADLYVSFAESDGASIALLEALALGAVPVVSDIASNRAWVRDGENGVLTTIDPLSAAEAIERALALDRSSVRAANQQLVGERADRERNLGRLEERLLAIAGAEGTPGSALGS
jgi:glycosyltransferase involved in cell wall biosynthesis